MVERWLAVMLEGIETHLVFTELHTEEMVGETLWDWDWKQTSPRTRTPLERTSVLWWCSASLTAPVWRTPRWSSTNCGRVASPAPSPSSWSGTRQTWSDPDKSPSRVRKIWQMRLWGNIYSDARNLARRHGVKYVEVSGELDHNVDTLLVGIVKQIRLWQLSATAGTGRRGQRWGQICERRGLF